MSYRGFVVKLDYVPGTRGCIFRCGNSPATPNLGVEMIVAPDGRFLTSDLDAEGTHRESGVAHPECFDAFYRVAHGVPFLQAASAR